MCEPPLKQSDVAAATGFTSPQLSDIERGDYKDVPLENCRRLADFFGCAIEDLFPPRVAEGDGQADLARRLTEDHRASQPADPGPVVGA